MASSIKFRSSDGQVIETDVEAAKRSMVIASMLEDLGQNPADEEIIPISNVNGKILCRVFKWAEHHKDEKLLSEKDMRGPAVLSQWDKDFLRVDAQTLYEIIMAADYLDMPDLLDASCAVVLSLLKGRSPEEVRRIFCVPE